MFISMQSEQALVHSVEARRKVLVLLPEDCHWHAFSRHRAAQLIGLDCTQEIMARLPLEVKETLQKNLHKTLKDNPPTMSRDEVWHAWQFNRQ